MVTVLCSAWEFLTAAFLIAAGILGIVTMSPIQSGHASYYIGYSDYLEHGGVAPGVIVGDGAALLGLDGPADPETVRSLFHLRDPRSGKALIELQYKPTAKKGKEPRVAIDLVFSAPKSVSVAYALADTELANEILRVFREAAQAGLREVQEGAVVRRGHGGRVRQRAGLIAICWTHDTSRALDPLLHEHCAISSAGVLLDGSTRALDKRTLFRRQQPCGRRFREALERGLNGIGLATKRDPDNDWSFRLSVVPLSLDSEFSTRRSEILATAKRKGAFTPAAREIAALDTRSAKQSFPRHVLRKRWEAAAAKRGFEVSALRRELRRLRSLPQHDRPLAVAAEKALPTNSPSRHILGPAVHRPKSQADRVPAEKALRARERAPDCRPATSGHRRHALKRFVDRSVRFLTHSPELRDFRKVSRSARRRGKEVIVLAPTVSEAQALGKKVAASKALSVAQCCVRAELTVGKQIRNFLSIRGVASAIDPFAFTRWAKGHRIVHNRRIFRRLELNDRVLIVQDANRVGFRRLVQLLELAHERRVDKVVIAGASPDQFWSAMEALAPELSEQLDRSRTKIEVLDRERER